MSRNDEDAQRSLRSRGVLVRLHGLKELRDGTISGIGRSWAGSGSRRGASINEPWVLVRGPQCHRQKGDNTKDHEPQSCHQERD
jgi:hypothetical protein